jgi:sulfur relay protein TusB/DsrH
MLVIIKSGPRNAETRKRLELARDLAADILLLEDGVQLASGGSLQEFCGTAHALDEDIRLRGLKDVDKGVRVISRGQLEELLSKEEKIGEMP